MVAEILGPGAGLAHNRAGANLVSGVLSALVEAPQAELGLFEVDEGAFPRIVDETHPRVVCLGNLFRDQLDRYGELELIAERWQAAVEGLSPSARVVVNVDDPALVAVAGDRGALLRFGLDDPSVARERLTHAADSKHCRRCGALLDYAAVYVGHLGDYRCGACGLTRPPLDVAGRRIRLQGLDATTFDFVTAGESRRIELALPGLYNVYNALAAGSVALELGASLDEVAAGLARFRPAFGRFERFEASGRTALLLLIKNPAGANEVIRTLVAGLDGDVLPAAVIALNDDVADGRDVSWIWDVDFELLAERLSHLVATGDRAEELALRFTYGGLPPERVEVERDLARALDRGLELTPSGGELPVLPTYTAMLGLREIAARRGLVKRYWEPTSGADSRVTTP
jgi:UDP-N-acetylmuramyl tripeptide synthase